MQDGDPVPGAHQSAEVQPPKLDTPLRQLVAAHAKRIEDVLPKESDRISAERIRTLMRQHAQGHMPTDELAVRLANLTRAIQTYLLPPFIDALRTISLVEQRGLEGVNARLAQLLQGLRETEALPPEARVQKLLELDTFMNWAIHLFPHLARSVDVELAPGARASLQGDQGDKTYDWDSFHERRLLGESLDAICDDAGHIMLPLPYWDSLHVEPGGMIGPMGVSWSSIYFDQEYDTRQGVRVGSTVVARLGISSRLGGTDEIPLTLDEIAGVRFSPSGRLTKLVSPRGPQERENHILHYLAFRGFFNIKNFVREIDTSRLDSQTRERFDRLYKPDIRTHLLRDEYESGPRAVLAHAFSKELLSKLYGFFAVGDTNPDHAELFELDGVPRPRRKGLTSSTSTLPLILDDILTGKQRTGVVRYKGTSVIERLMTIPV